MTNSYSSHLTVLFSYFKTYSRSITLQCHATLKKCSLKTKNKYSLLKCSKLVKAQKVAVFSTSSNNARTETRERFNSKYLPTHLPINSSPTLLKQPSFWNHREQADSTEQDALVLNSTYGHTRPQGKSCM